MIQKNLMIEINDIVNKIYQITDKEKELIFNFTL